MEIIFYAPLGKNLPPEKCGGAESGCNKTLKIYRDHGVKVYIVDKAAMSNDVFVYLLATLLSYLKFCWACIRHPKAVVHIVGFYGKVIRMESLLVRTSRFFGHTTVYEMRNGGLVNIYKNSNKKYRKIQRRIWSKADGLLCQGEEFVKFIRKEAGRSAFYYPNYIQNSDKFKEGNRFCNDKLNLVYFGRLVRAKNIDLIIQTVAEIYKKHPEVKLHLIGGIQCDFQTELNKLIFSEKLPEDVVVFHGKQDFDYIADILLNSHFFLFPSSEQNEGHSNSLTEAMGYGVVPVASIAGFNKRICADPDFIVTDLDPVAYADRVLKLWDENTWYQKSRQVRKRIIDNFTEDIVGARLMHYLEDIKKKTSNK